LWSILVQQSVLELLEMLLGMLLVTLLEMLLKMLLGMLSVTLLEMLLEMLLGMLLVMLLEMLLEMLLGMLSGLVELLEMALAWASVQV